MNKESQKRRIMEHFDRGGTLSRRTAMLDLGIGNLPARIEELRADGHPITTRMVRRRGVRYGVYKLDNR